MKLTKSQLKQIIKEEILIKYATLTCEQNGYTLTEQMIQEINWSKIGRLVKKGVTGLALAMVLMGASPGQAMAWAPPECTGEAGVCQIQIPEPDLEEMQSYLAKAIQKYMDKSGVSYEDAAEAFGWDSDWGNYQDYLQKDVTKEQMKLTKSKLKQIIKEELESLIIKEDFDYNPTTNAPIKGTWLEITLTEEGRSWTLLSDEDVVEEWGEDPKPKEWYEKVKCLAKVVQVAPEKSDEEV